MSDSLNRYPILERLVARQKLIDRLGREPTVREMIDKLYEMGLEQIHARMQRRVPASISSRVW